MKVKIFSQPSASAGDFLEDEVNTFLAKLPEGAVRYVRTCANNSSIIFSVWYEDDKQLTPMSVERSGSEQLSDIIGSAVAQD